MGTLIRLADLLQIGDPTKYKLHLACRNEDWVSPLDEYVADRADWVGWNKWKGSRNDWTREFIFAVIEFYPKKDHWLFGGVFKVLKRHRDHYEVESVAGFDKYVGRLLFRFHRYQGMRGRAYLLESYIDDLEVAEIFPVPYTGESFCGYENVNHDFSTLESIFANGKEDWSGALRNVKGIYLIVDKSNRKAYVGSAYGDQGLWDRWACYIGTGHGYTDSLSEVIESNGMEYARKNLKFSILEIMSMTASDEFVKARESHWKNVLLTRAPNGYNKN